MCSQEYGTGVETFKSFSKDFIIISKCWAKMRFIMGFCLSYISTFSLPLLCWTGNGWDRTQLLRPPCQRLLTRECDLKHQVGLFRQSYECSTQRKEGASLWNDRSTQWHTFHIYLKSWIISAMLNMTQIKAANFNCRFYSCTNNNSQSSFTTILSTLWFKTAFTQHQVVPGHFPNQVIGQMDGVDIDVLMTVLTYRLYHLPPYFIARFLESRKHLKLES